MSPEAQRLAFAKACPGWAVHHGGRYCSITNCKNPTLAGKLFDPLNDLNATHEAEKVLSTHPMDGDLANYFNNLDSLCGGSVMATFATAAQRAEAFLRTLGLWVETKD